MKFLTLEPFVPSGSNYEGSKQLFQELGFTLNWESGGCAGFQRDDCRFILQQYDQPGFTQHYMLGVKVSSITEFRDHIINMELPEKFGIKVSQIIQQPYGNEVNLIDIAGVLWHFIE